MTHLVVVGGRGWVLLEVLRRARERGCLVTVIQEHRHVRDEHGRLAREVCGVESLLDVDEVERVVRSVRQRKPVDSIFSLTEYGLEAAALVGERLDIRTSVSSSLVRLLRNKGALRDFLRTSEQFRVGHAVVSSAAEAAAAFLELRVPVVVKPGSAAGSLGVTFAQTRAEVRAAFERARLISPDVIVEEYLDGPEFSVEAFSHEGRHLVAAITRKYKAGNFVEIGHVVPGLAGPKAAQLREYVVDFLDAVGLADGSSHTEVILTPQGPRIVESHNRQGGDSIPMLVMQATGVNLADLEVVARAGDPSWTLPNRVPTEGAAAIRFWASDCPGVVVARPALADQLDERESLTLVVDVGHPVEPLLHSSDRLGWVITVADSAHDAYSRAEALVREYPFEVTEVPSDQLRPSDDDRLRQYAAEGR